MSDLPKTELEAAEMIRDGSMPSMSKYHNVWLANIRITGTGAAYRTIGKGEYTWRNPDFYMNPEFLKRCAGLAVILEHPKKGTLDSDEYADRAVGSVFLPYLKDEEKEVWAIAKIYDADTASFLRENQLSTSPAVILTPGDEGITHLLDDGSKLLIENEAVLLDHIAICEQGVWDKGGAPCGVDNGSGESAVADKEEVKSDPKDEQKEEIKEDAKKADSGDDKMAAFMDSVMKRMDSMASRMDAWEKPKTDAEEEKEEKEEKKEEAKADASEDKAKADAASDLAKRLDAMEEAMKPKADSEADEKAEKQAKCDSAYSAHGERAPAPMVGEKARAYHLRMLKPLQRHSTPWKDIDLSALPDPALAIAADAIRADAVKAALTPSNIPEGALIERRTKVGEHTHVTFHGTFDAGFADFKRPPSFAKFGGLNSNRSA